MTTQRLWLILKPGSAAHVRHEPPTALRPGEHAVPLLVAWPSTPPLVLINPGEQVEVIDLPDEPPARRLRLYHDADVPHALDMLSLDPQGRYRVGALDSPTIVDLVRLFGSFEYVEASGDVYLIEPSEDYPRHEYRSTRIARDHDTREPHLTNGDDDD